jgi:hypothetical protein
MLQDVGAEMNRKNRAVSKAIWGDFFNSIMPKRLRKIGLLINFNFGFRANCTFAAGPAGIHLANLNRPE